MQCCFNALHIKFRNVRVPKANILLGEGHTKGAEEKFRQVQKAYEHIQKERGMK